ncbi:molecular chaperone [Halomonas halocynthiae]|uniref:molecular chaperone n=1 Tax=Halomonas halocynthiae TaxID=176290 RepID=UPI000424C56D|nr:molecular chaperone [Halomonas halocynthiae]
MRYSLPLFDYGEGLSASADGSDAAASLSWQLVQDGGRHYLQISNAGKRHVRLTNVFFQQGSGRQVVSDGLLGYVLPGNFRRWPLERPASADSMLSVTVNGAAVTLTSRGTLN